ncbi:hypothetical protein [Streptomyces sp. NPDC017940]|uniref:hypothetical protein n=1 Tax=Streptomyces sp. NPDC017940 TaxID=3365017 RepID=UPI0037A0F4B9
MPADEQHRQPYGYQPQTVAHCQRISLRPEPSGGLLFDPFDPANFHVVGPCPGQRRITFTLFLALTTTGQHIAWS